MNQERILQVLRRPHLSEKTTILGDKGNQAVFEVARDASKPEVKRAVQELFKVKVLSVNILSVPAKRKRFGGRPGSRTAWKKAYVRLAPGEDLDFLGLE